MLKLILVRHGEDEKEISKEGYEMQKDDAPLTQRGINQVRKLAIKLKLEKIDKIYSSDLKRAFQTASIIEDEIELKVDTDIRLRERNIGEFEKYGDKWREFFNEYKKNKLKEGFPLKEIRPKGGENVYDFRNRISIFLSELEKKEGNILIIAHKGVNEAIINLIMGRQEDVFKPIEQEYTCVNILVFSEEKWKIVSINDASHLLE